MELETALDNVFHNVDHPVDMMHHSSIMEITKTDIFYEDESFVFQSVVFDSQSKILIIEKRDVRNKKGKSRSEINLSTLGTCIRPKSLDFTEQPKMLLMIPLEDLKPRMPD
jgi:hypothetical protein